MRNGNRDKQRQNAKREETDEEEGNVREKRYGQAAVAVCARLAAGVELWREISHNMLAV